MLGGMGPAPVCLHHRRSASDVRRIREYTVDQRGAGRELMVGNRRENLRSDTVGMSGSAMFPER